jgi:hypothetical protein
MPEGVVSRSAGAPHADAARAGARRRRAIGVCALAASIPALAAGAVPLGVMLIGAAQVAFAASLRRRVRVAPRVAPRPADGWAPAPDAPWHALARPASLWRPSAGDWPAGAPDVELSLN